MLTPPSYPTDPVASIDSWRRHATQSLTWAHAARAHADRRRRRRAALLTALYLTTISAAVTGLLYLTLH